MQELHEADLAASVAQEQLMHERQRTGRLKQAIKSAFEDARTPAAGLTGGSSSLLHSWHAYDFQWAEPSCLSLCGHPWLHGKAFAWCSDVIFYIRVFAVLPEALSLFFLSEPTRKSAREPSHCRCLVGVEHEVKLS